MSRRPASLGAAAGEGVISLAMGEPSEGTSQVIVEAAIAALSAGRTRYEALSGSPTLRAAIATHRHVTADRVVCTHGASAGLAAAILATVNTGDRVVIPEPTYSLYADHVAMAGGEVVWVANRRDGSVDVEAIKAALDGARMLVVCSPGNPTGAVIGREILQALSDATAAAGAYLLCDEAYSEIVFDDVPFASSLDLDGEREHVICAQTFSKTFAMTGWRLGYVIAASGVANAINLVHRTLNGALSTFVQDAGVAALGTHPADLRALALDYQKRRDMVVAALDGVEMVPPQGAFYAFLRPNTSLSSDELVARFAEAGVLVRSGVEYGPSGEGAFRISFAAGRADLAEGLARIKGVLG